MYRKNKPTCSTCGDEQPTHTDDGTDYPKRCEACRTPEDVNIVEQKCDTCGLLSLINSDMLDCSDCHAFLTRAPHKARETMVRDILVHAGIAHVHDRVAAGSCHRYRPDFVIDCGAHVIILEVDEEQHRGYDCRCEQARMINLVMDQGGLPTVFVRFNPDAYRDSAGVRRQWANARGVHLVELVRKLMSATPTAFCTAIYMYYDGYERTAPVTHVLDIDTLTVQLQ